ncbi:MAG: Mini-ribonuclease 3 [Clostridiales bacterium]|nr:Mini-ribonuclease 3 [Clostridiales bacterium]
MENGTLLSNKNLIEVNPLVLAYMGDTIFETYIREQNINKGICKIKDLAKETLKYVNAKSQASFIKIIIDNNILKEDELDIVKRARNSKSNHKPKSCDVLTYKYATALESLLGYLYYKDKNRLEFILNYIYNIKVSI